MFIRILFLISFSFRLEFQLYSGLGTEHSVTLLDGYPSVLWSVSCNFSIVQLLLISL